MIEAVGLGTPLCERLGIEHPVFCAGMGSAAGPELVAAVSNAGGFGVLGASGCTPEEIRRRAGRVRELTGRPWAGESCAVVNDIKPAAEIVRDLMLEAEAALTQPTALT
ncbi:MAG TPA: nitronate monooxygenase [Streptosporangiaceae bacterium]|nr:nitronate monooxygenase [Streptosporangiaceae bacterium]